MNCGLRFDLVMLQLFPSRDPWVGWDGSASVQEWERRYSAGDDDFVNWDQVLVCFRIRRLRVRFIADGLGEDEEE